MRAEAEKLAKEIVDARAELGTDLQKLKDELADLKMSSEAVARERDQLYQEVDGLLKEMATLQDVMVELQTYQEYKDEHIDHLTFLLEPHLSFLLAEVANEIHNMLEVIGVSMTPLILELSRWLMLLSLLLLLMLSLFLNFPCNHTF